MDQIYIKDYICDAEIGVFKSEYGRKQRLRFNVILSIDYENSNVSDSIEDVVSYEIIVNAINENLSGKRLNLLETLAKNISDSCLEVQQVKKIEIHIEKLDRIDGCLGIRLIREKD